MNKTVTLPEIAAQVAAMAGVDVDMATRFIAAMFAGVEQRLAAGESVALDGIGTFRRNSAMPSAVEFEPDKDLAAAVNAPFALFSPVEMPEGTAPDIFDEKDTEGEDAAETPAAEETVQETVEPETQPEEEIQEPEPETEPADEPAEKEEELPENDTPADDTDIEKEVIYIERRRSPWPWIAAILALAAGFGGGYFFGFRNSIISGIEPVAAAEKTAMADTVTAPPVAENVSDTIAEAPAVEEKTEENVKEEEKEPAKEPVYDTVSSSRFLTTISRDHYGRKDYWVFIYEANSDILKHPNRIRPGTRVLIPDLGPHAALDPDMRARARVLATEIYNRYDM